MGEADNACFPTDKVMKMNASGFSRRVADLDLSAATDTQLMQLEDVLPSPIRIGKRVKIRMLVK